jgi:hypothetical protein
VPSVQSCRPERHDCTVVVVLGAVPSGLALVDLVARLQLLARGTGCTMTVRDPSPELSELLDFAGLTELLGCGLQAGGQAEGREQLGVQEVLPGDNPPA